METTRSILPLGFVLVCLSPFVALSQDPSEPSVSLILSNVTIQGDPPRFLFRCKATLDNATAHEVQVRSNFSSVFDGLDLVITNQAGKVLVQQRYLYHQSPRTLKPADFVLKKGRTSRELVFPVATAGFAEKSVKVRLVGTLPGSTYQRILSTDTLTVELLDGALRAERRILRDDRDAARKPQSFALAGFFDFNNNGETDIVILRELITNGGGTIDAEIDRDGNMKGKLTATTGCVILGKGPTKKDSTPETIEKFAEFTDLAKELNVEIVSVGRLLGFGSVRPDRNKDAAEQFRPRRPPRPSPGGAY